jgi:hypothetical protein
MQLCLPFPSLLVSAFDLPNPCRSSLLGHLLYNEGKLSTYFSCFYFILAHDFQLNLQVLLKGREGERVEELDVIVPAGDLGARHEGGVGGEEEGRGRGEVVGGVEGVGVAEGRGLLLRQAEGVLAEAALVFELRHLKLLQAQLYAPIEDKPFAYYHSLVVVFENLDDVLALPALPLAHHSAHQSRLDVVVSLADLHSEVGFVLAVEQPPAALLVDETLLVEEELFG